MFSISSSIWCCDRFAVPCPSNSQCRPSIPKNQRGGRAGGTLKAKCSRKCAVPFVSSVSALEPASIHMPTVDVCAHGEYSVATYARQVRGARLAESNWEAGDGAHGHSIFERRGLSLADRRGSREASSQGEGGRRTSTSA